MGIGYISDPPSFNRILCRFCFFLLSFSFSFPLSILLVSPPRGWTKDKVCQVEAKYPALLFKQQLTAYVEKIYGIIRDNSKKDLSSLLSSCIQTPGTTTETIQVPRTPTETFQAPGTSTETIQAPGTSTENSLRSSGISFDSRYPTNDWKSIIESLKGTLSTLQDNFVPPVLVQRIFTQIFSYIDVQLFNSLLLRRECCTFSNGEYVKAGLDELELWCGHAKEKYVGSSWDELKHVRQAVGFLVIHQKLRITYEDLTSDLCPMLTIQQLYRICTLYRDDNFNTSSVSPDIISSMKNIMMLDSHDADSNSFLLDDNSSIPFSVDDISSSLQDSDFTGVKAAAELLKRPSFQFLQG
ncbi:myosin-6-like [Olea europaea var. sylvestris]|uniref:myosin-6-like n=1 Tax=Olea europaea var. sylvestris TaxID=158386 RepID=UPI000C1D0B96|nr:myosin-6-like [Olea europaea var. sylvestris]